ncbi:MAG: VWA domain-containing protein [Fuerstiella sp.]|nr:VWA domain-containing protein [Fuerstiella sp.]
MTYAWPQLELTRPEWLWAVLLLPVLVVYFYRSLVDLPSRQMIASLVVRCLIVLFLILALCGLNWLDRTQQVFVVFAVDESLSIGEAGREKSQDFIRRATADRDKNSFALLPFASMPGSFRTDLPDVAEPVLATADVAIRTSDTDAGSHESRRKWQQGSNLQSVIATATAGVPPHFVPHVVLLTDGNQTEGDVMAAVTLSGPGISTVHLPTRDEPELQVSTVNVPAQVAEGEPFRIEVVIDSNHDDTAIVEVFGGDYRIASELRELRKGENKFYFTQQIKQPTEFSARITKPASSQTSAADSAPVTATVETFNDTLLDNNMASGMVFTSGRPRVLLIENIPEQARHLEWAMNEEGIAVDTRPAQGMPESLTDLQNYEVLILSNVPATKLSAQQMDVIRAYVSQLGGGFIMLGGDQAFGLGGYYKTVVEDVLPVRSDFEKEKEKPGLGMVLIIDKSGSMGGQKLEMAKDAARAAVDLLGAKDQIGVIAFDGSPYWVSEIRGGSQKGAVMDRIASIESGGGTALYPAMEQAYEALQAISAKLKHIIVLTDGLSTPGDFDGITNQMAASRITVSTVGIGDADQNLLERVAQAGRGRYYFATDVNSIPQIFAKETMTASKSAINEDPFLPILIRSTPVLDGVNFDESPFLLGYVVTRPKATSEVILTAETGDPLLCWWRYGLGMAVAFTSDAKSRWAAEWVTWNGYNKFWAQVIRHCMRKSESNGFVVDVQRHGSHSKVVIDAVDSEGRFLNMAETEITLIDPKLTSSSIAVQQTAPGRYEAEMEMATPGAWHVQVTQNLDGQTMFQQTRGMVVGYSDELRLRPADEDLLKSIASASGGTFEPEAASVFTPLKSKTASAATPIWPQLLLIAMTLFVADVALRRLDMSRIFGSELHRGELRS